MNMFSSLMLDILYNMFPHQKKSGIGDIKWPKISFRRTRTDSFCVTVLVSN